jgi:hypothetical protein
MLKQIAWGFCKIAFDAAQEECFPEPMRRGFRRLGSLWFWLALLLEGRALAAFCEGRSGESRARAFAHQLALLMQGCLRRWRWPQPQASEGPSVPAWSLPSLPHLQTLGLGDVWAVRCPFCRDFHTHHPGEGSRQPACASGAAPAAYQLVHAGELPRVLHQPFRQAMKQAWPKLLLAWPQHEATPALLKAA